MGLLRTLLALSVVLSHTLDFVFVGGRNAVQLFYLISGFLISYVLVERRAYPRIRDFYLNRYLRLYPIYAVVALMTLALFSIPGLGLERAEAFFDVYHRAPAAADALLIFSNLTLFLQDWVLFAGVEQGGLVFTPRFFDSEVVLWPGLLVTQAWTLGVELTFYLVAPFLLPRRRLVIALVLLSILVRGILVATGIGLHDPWTYRFFPAELALFLLGALSHQFLLPFYRRVLTASQLGIAAPAATAFLLALILGFGLLPLPQMAATALIIGLFVLLLPFTFLFQSGNSWDRRIGDISYPLYIGHYIVLDLVNRIAGPFGESHPLAKAALMAVVSLGFALLLNGLVGRPVEWLRDRIKGKSR